LKSDSDISEFIFEPLDSKHDRAAFSCEEPALERYLKRQARQDVEKNLAAVFVMTPDGNAIAGFYTLSHYSIQTNQIPAEIAQRLTRHGEIPATLIGRLARNIAYRGSGAGDLLLLNAFGRCLDSSKQAASWAAVVDAKNEASVKFYKKWGFNEFPSQPLKLFLPTATVEKMFL
jgi:predicted GNAT family N-acyltransferase